MTDAERKLWYLVRARRLAGWKFIRQFPIGPYFADFCCREANLIIEADGSHHAESVRDTIRDNFLLTQGYRVLRFWNHDILNDIDMVRETVLAALENRLEPYERYKIVHT
jgi:very-short-patch-repair endonuclease